jgi:fatty-acyl-CoA synthase
LHAFFDRAAGEYADRPLIRGDERSWTYREICSWSEELAQGLLRRGVKPGDRVAMVMANYVEFLVVKLAISRVGAVAVPFNFLYRRDEMAFVLRQSRSHYLITMNSFRGLDYLATLDELAPSWADASSTTGASGASGALAAAFPDLRSVFVFMNEDPTAGGSPARPGMTTLDELRAPDTTSAPLPFPAVSPDDISDIFFTSGSTGTPRGAVMRHDPLLRSGYAAAVTRALPDGRRTLFALPLYHCFAYVEGLLAVPWVGGSLVLQLAFTPAGYLGGIQRHRAEEILAVPTMMVALLEHPERASYDISSLDCIFSGAAPTPRWVWDRVREELGATELVTGWGMTEVGAGLTITQPEDPIELHVTTVGRVKHCGDAGITADPSVFVEIRTIDPLTGEHLPEGADGEVVVRGVTVMERYWDRPEETAATMVDGWLRTGDLGRVLPNGYLQLSGRTKELYKSGGELVMPKEIEELLTAVPGVSQVFAIGVPDDRWGEMGCAVIVRDVAFAGEPVTEGSLLAICRERLARFKVPKHIVFLAVAELPTTATGKVQKFRLVTQMAERLRPPPS